MRKTTLNPPMVPRSPTTATMADEPVASSRKAAVLPTSGGVEREQAARDAKVFRAKYGYGFARHRDSRTNLRPSIQVEEPPPLPVKGRNAGLDAKGEQKAKDAAPESAAVTPPTATDAPRPSGGAVTRLLSAFSKRSEGRGQAEPPTGPTECKSSSTAKQFRLRFDVYIPGLSSPLSGMTLKGIGDFCRALAKHGVGPADLQDLLGAIEGRTEQAGAQVWSQKIGSVIIKGRRDAATIEEDLLAIFRCANLLKEKFAENYPATGKAALRESAEKFVQKMVELSSENQVSKVTHQGYADLRTELQFWATAAEQVLATGIPRETMVGNRENFLKAMRIVQDRAQHLTRIADRYTTPDQIIFNQFQHGVSPDDLVAEYLADKGADQEMLPSKDEIAQVRNFIDRVSVEVRVAEVNPYAMHDSVAAAGPSTATTQEAAPLDLTPRWSDKVVNYALAKSIIDQRASVKMTTESLALAWSGMLNEYASRTATVQHRFKTEWRKDWAERSTARAYEHLGDWPASVVDALKAGIADKTLTLHLTSPEKKTRFIEALSANGLRTAWTLDAALTEANKWADVKLTEQDAKRARKWLVDFLSASTRKMEKIDG